MVDILKIFQSDNSGVDNCYTEVYNYFSPTEIEAALIVYYVGLTFGCSIDKLDSITSTRSPDNRIIKTLYKLLDKHGASEIQKAESVQSYISTLHYVHQVDKWKKCKQSFVFDKDMITELARTDTNLSIPYNIFDRLPYHSLYIDFSENPEINKITGMEGCLAYVTKTNADDKEFWVMFYTLYKDNQSVSVRGNVIPNKPDNMEITMNNFADGLENIYDENGNIILDIKKQMILITQAMLYLCSYEPDIREDTVSKARYQKNKNKGKKKSNKKADAPTRTYKVGERFGTAYRKWTKSGVGKENSSVATGRHNKPHLRKAHWHRYWIGKRNSDERELVIKWVSECLCGAEKEDKLETVKHKVKKK